MKLSRKLRILLDRKDPNNHHHYQPTDQPTNLPTNQNRFNIVYSGDRWRSSFPRLSGVFCNWTKYGWYVNEYVKSEGPYETANEEGTCYKGMNSESGQWFKKPFNSDQSKEKRNERLKDLYCEWYNIK